MTQMSSNQPGFVRTPTAIPIGSLGLVASTDLPGFALQNALAVLLSWTAPNDGMMHRVMVFGSVNVASTETGGSINLNGVDPQGGAISSSVDAGAHAAGVFAFTSKNLTVAPGTLVQLKQAAVLSAGAAVAYAELWAS